MGFSDKTPKSLLTHLMALLFSVISNNDISVSMLNRATDVNVSFVFLVKLKPPWSIFQFQATIPASLMWCLGKQSDKKHLLFINLIEGVLDDSSEDSKEMGSVCRLLLF